MTGNLRLPSVQRDRFLSVLNKNLTEMEIS